MLIIILNTLMQNEYVRYSVFAVFAVVLVAYIYILLFKIIPSIKEKRKGVLGNDDNSANLTVRILKDENDYLIAYEEKDEGRRNRTVRLKSKQYKLLKNYFLDNMPYVLAQDFCDCCRNHPEMSAINIYKMAKEKYDERLIPKSK